MRNFLGYDAEFEDLGPDTKSEGEGYDAEFGEDRYPLYYNPDGSVGYKLDLGHGAYLTINDAMQVAPTKSFNERWNQRNLYYHEKLLGMGVKAYRVNDAKVDRTNLKVTFTRDNRDPGFYWGSPKILEKGDKIFIGDVSRGGRFAVITGLDSVFGNWSKTYNFKWLDETFDCYEELVAKEKKEAENLEKAKKKAERKAERNAKIQALKTKLFGKKKR